MNNGETYTVSELTTQLKMMIEGEFPTIKLQGEISNYRPSSTGHAYFTLKDEHAAISAVMFKRKLSFLTFTPKDGQMVQVNGALSVYEIRGSYQIVIDSMEEAGSGNILLMLEERKRRFAEAGFFDSDKKKSLPFFPRHVGVITSPTGAALKDILQIIHRRNPKVSVTVLPCPVQGKEAGEKIAQQIYTANICNIADVLIVGRGGGSLEDLLPFSEEQVIHAIADSTIPVISAVGHEIDWALSDFVADIRAPTPSAAAELAVPLLDDIKQSIIRFTENVQLAIIQKTRHMRLILNQFSSDNLELRFRTIEQPILQRFDYAKEDLLLALWDKVKEYRHALQYARVNLEGANPHEILKRGYSMVRDKTTKNIIRGPQDTTIGKSVEIIAKNGTLNATVV